MRLLTNRFSRRSALVSLAAVHLTFAICLLGADAFAERSLPALSNGMTYTEVIASWGVPLSKEERETSRNDVWLYARGKVIFHEGRVTGWVVNGASSEAEAQAPSAAARSVPQAAPERTEEVEQILNEIMKELPSEDSGAAGAGGISPSPGKPANPPLPHQVLGVPPQPVDVE